MSDSLAAYQFDVAVAVLGAMVEERLAQRDEEGPIYTVESVLEELAAGRQYRSFGGSA